MKDDNFCENHVRILFNFNAFLMIYICFICVPQMCLYYKNIWKCRLKYHFHFQTLVRQKLAFSTAT